jgi:DNA adenine methylase
MRAEFDRLRHQRAEDLTDIERAARFLYLQKLAFGGKVTGRTFGIDPTKPHNFDLRALGPRLERLHARLQSVVIEHLDWGQFIPLYDRPGTLFYLDPPYWGGEDDYGKQLFAPADFERMAVALRRIEGRFLLSINDVPEIRTAFAWADMVEVETTYTVARGAASKVGELLIGRDVNLQAVGGQGSLF